MKSVTKTLLLASAFVLLLLALGTAITVAIASASSKAAERVAVAAELASLEAEAAAEAEVVTALAEPTYERDDVVAFCTWSVVNAQEASGFPPPTRGELFDIISWCVSEFDAYNADQ